MQEEPKENPYKFVNEPPDVKYSTPKQTNQLSTNKYETAEGNI